MKKGKVSIVIPCFNQGKYLAETLDSVLAQTWSDWECIVVNDGSTDNTDMVAKEYLRKDNRFKYIVQDNQGQAVSRNNAIHQSDGEFILPLDSDDIIAPTYIEKAINCFTSTPEIKLVYCNAEFFGERSGTWALEEYNYDNFIWKNCIFVSSVFRRCDYDKTGGYNPNMKNRFEDWDFYLSLLGKEDKVIKLDEVLFYYRKKEKKSVAIKTDALDIYKEEALVQLYHNHEDIYAPYLPHCQERVVLYHDDSPEKLRSELRQICSSNAYRLGKFLLRPFLLIKKIL